MADAPLVPVILKKENQVRVAISKTISRISKMIFTTSSRSHLNTNRKKKEHIVSTRFCSVAKSSRLCGIIKNFKTSFIYFFFMSLRYDFLLLLGHDYSVKPYSNKILICFFCCYESLLRLLSFLFFKVSQN